MGDPQGDLVELTRRSMTDANGGDFDAATAVFAEDAVFNVRKRRGFRVRWADGKIAEVVAGGDVEALRHAVEAAAEGR